MMRCDDLPEVGFDRVAQKRDCVTEDILSFWCSGVVVNASSRVNEVIVRP
jgi:hypothetical protein